MPRNTAQKIKIGHPSSLKMYGMILCAIALWWVLAFSSGSDNSHSISYLPSAATLPDDTFPITYPYLSSMSRDTLHKALAGDVSLMTELIAEWDVDAQIIESHGVKNTKRLSRQQYLRGRLLSRHLMQTTPLASDSKYLPQTYQSASFLTALAGMHQISALPKGLREQTTLYPLSMTNQIPLDIAPYQFESLHPITLAFVSKSYTHPGILLSLIEQKIPVVAQRHISTLNDIIESLREVGQAIDQQQKAELLTIFMEAAMIAIDNRLMAITHLQPETKSDTPIAYLMHYSQYSIPTAKSLTGQLLERLSPVVPFIKAEEGALANQSYFVPIEHEKLIAWNPRCLFISTHTREQLWEHLLHYSSLKELSAVQLGRVYFLDETVQLTSDQYIVLAYYDIANRLLNELRI